jgi:hypothetical protein
MKTEKLKLVDSKYLCPKCKNNTDLNKVTISTSAKFLFWETSSNVIEYYIICENCKNRYSYHDLETINSSSTNNKFDRNKTETIETYEYSNTIVIEKTINVNYSNYVPNVKSKELYFEMIILIMLFIKENDRSINIENNKFYQLALENTGENIDLENTDLESKIFQKAELCSKEFKGIELQYLLQNSINVLKGKYAINQNITNLYFKLFDVMEIRTIGKETYFYSLLE